MHLLELDSISKTFGSVQALRPISLSVEVGERLVLFGSSGAGKTTLLNLIAGLQSAGSGRIRLAGEDITDIEPSKRQVSMLSQSVSLYPQLSVHKNLEAAVQRLGLPRAERSQRIETLLQGFQISHLSGALPGDLSGGEKQRVAFARAMIAEPRLLLLDEPISQLDGPSRENAISLLDEVSSRFKPTTVLVSHDPIDAMRLADRIAIMHDGELVDFGTPEHVYRNPSCRLSGRLLGVHGMNWIDTQSEDCDENIRALTKSRSSRGGETSRFFGFRPEAALVSVDSGQSVVQLSVRVERIYFVGSSFLVEGSLGTQSVVILTRERYLAGDLALIELDEANCCWVAD